MLVIKSHDAKTGVICNLEIPGNLVLQEKVSQELQSGKYPSHFAFSHRGANLEIHFRSTDEYCDFATWIFRKIQKSSET